MAFKNSCRISSKSVLCAYYCILNLNQRLTLFLSQFNKNYAECVLKKYSGDLMKKMTAEKQETKTKSILGEKK